MDYINNLTQQETSETGMIYDLGSVFDYFTRIPDKRKARGKQYSLACLLLLIMLAKLGGEDKPSGITDWVTERKEKMWDWKILPCNKTPCHMTYRRVFQEIVEPEEFEKILSCYAQDHLKDGEKITLSMDGKTLRGTIPKGERQGTHLLSIFVPDQGLALAEVAVDRKENEISAAPKVLKQVNLKGKIVIGDAMHTQREASKQILDAGGDYIWVVKGNQARTQWAIEKLFTYEVCNLQKGRPLSKDFQMQTQVSKGHGRLEKRTIMVSSLLNEYLDWPGVSQVFRVERVVWHSEHQGQTRKVVYGLTSLSAEKIDLAHLQTNIRKYWGIENGLHYRRDVTLHEDATRLTIGNAGHNMAIFNNLVIGLTMLQGLTNLAEARRKFFAHPQLALRMILSPNFRLC
jgi:predicted transposase YbfD/YdcC